MENKVHIASLNNINISKEMSITNLTKIAYKFLQEITFFERLQQQLTEHTMSLSTVQSSPFLIITDLEIDLIKLFDFSGDLYLKVTGSPVAGCAIFEEAIDNVIKRNSTNFFCKLLMRSTSLPLLAHGSCYAAQHGALCLFRQYVLIAMTMPVMENYYTFYRCSDHSCKGYLGQYLSTIDLKRCQHIRCINCKRVMIDEFLNTRQIEFAFARFTPAVAFKGKKNNLYLSVKCFVQESLQEKLELGAEYDFWGYHTFDHFVIWGLQKQNIFLHSSLSSDSILKLRNMRSTIESVYPNNPWLLVENLASQVGHEYRMLRHFRSLKMALILSLASMVDNVPLPIICVGSDYEAANILMNCASTLAVRRVEVNVPLSGLIRQHELDEHIWLHGGMLITASSGICLIDDWQSLKSIQKKEILSVIETKKVTITNKKGGLGGIAPVSLSLPLKAAIWAFFHWHHHSDMTTFKDVTQYYSSLNNLLNIFLTQICEMTSKNSLVFCTSYSTFGIPFIATFEDDTEILRLNAMMDDLYDYEPGMLSNSELSELLTIVNSIEIKFDKDATKLLQDYCAANRRVRTDVFPKCSMNILTSLAGAHTRLSLRGTVTYNDVVAVIYLYEESLCYLYGYAFYDTPPLREVQHNTHEGMNTFKDWLKGYIESININFT